MIAKFKSEDVLKAEAKVARLKRKQIKEEMDVDSSSSDDDDDDDHKSVGVSDSDSGDDDLIQNPRALPFYSLSEARWVSQAEWAPRIAYTRVPQNVGKIPMLAERTIEPNASGKSQKCVCFFKVCSVSLSMR